MYNLSRFEKKYGDKIEVRRAIVADAQSIMEAQYIAFPNDPTNQSVEEIQNHIEDEQHGIFTGFFDGEFAGYAATHSKRFRPWTNGNSLVVIDKHASKGIGAFLLREAIVTCPKLAIRIFVEKKNGRAIRLYKKFGFFRIQQIANHYENGDDAFVMVKLTFGFSN